MIVKKDAFIISQVQNETRSQELSWRPTDKTVYFNKLKTTAQKACKIITSRNKPKINKLKERIFINFQSFVEKYLEASLKCPFVLNEKRFKFKMSGTDCQLRENFPARFWRK